MSKELTPLETFRKMQEFYVFFDTDINIIETALKRYEDLERTHLFTLKEYKKQKKEIFNLQRQNANYQLQIFDNSKKIKALEIIKEHITSISFKYGGILGNVIKLKIDCDTCYIHFNEDDKNFDLLKEVLIYGK